MSSPTAPFVDEQDQRLLAQVRPSGWRNPAPRNPYDLVVIGGGTAGLVAAAGAAALGARVALIERRQLGGDCLNTGCVPSKALLRSARAVDEARRSDAVGVHARTEVDFPAVMARLRGRRADLAHADAAARFAALGVDVFFAAATFTGGDALAAGGVTLRFRRAVIATGSRPFIPEIAGLATVAPLTTDTIWQLDEQPRSLVILGAGAVGCELAQAFALLGTRVTLIDREPQVLPGEDADAAAIVAARLTACGVDLCLGATIDSVARSGAQVTVRLSGEVLAADAILVAAGRQPAFDDLGLEAAGVSYRPGGVTVDDFLRTTNRRIYASGDVCSRFKFTHAADAMSRIVIQNALFHGRRRMSALVIPWCTFTSPELAHVGLTSREAAAAGAETITVPLTDVDRAVLDEETEGFLRVHHHRGRPLGATIVAAHAGETIGAIASLMRRRGSLGELAAEIAPYPTLSLGLRRLGDVHRRQALTPRVARLLKWYFRIFR